MDWIVNLPRPLLIFLSKSSMRNVRYFTKSCSYGYWCLSALFWYFSFSLSLWILSHGPANGKGEWVRLVRQRLNTILTKIGFSVGKQWGRTEFYKIVLANLCMCWVYSDSCRTMTKFAMKLTDSSQKSLLSTSTYWDISSSSIAFWKSAEDS